MRTKRQIIDKLEKLETRLTLIETIYYHQIIGEDKVIFESNLNMEELKKRFKEAKI